VTGLFVLLSGTSFVVGFFAFTWSRGCLHQTMRLLEERDEDLGGGKLEYSRMAEVDSRLARNYRMGLVIWVVSGVAFVGFGAAALLI